MKSDNDNDQTFHINRETAVEARQFSEDPIINYAGWGFIAGHQSQNFILQSGFCPPFG